MKTKKGIKPSLPASLSIPVAIVLSYICAICALPSSGILTALPVTALSVVIISIFCKDRKFIYTSVALMHFITPLLFGYDIIRGVISAVIATATAVFVILAKRGFITSKKAESDTIKSKGTVIFIISVIACVLIWIFCLGNPISHILSHSDNVKSARALYGDSIQVGNTYYDIFKSEYITQITFDEGDPGKKYYFSAKKTDDYKDFYIDEMLLDAVEYFHGKTAISPSIVTAYIDRDDFVFDSSAANNKNLPNITYVLKMSERVTGLNNFKDLYNSMMQYANQSDNFVYKSIIMTASGLESNMYFAEKQYGEDVKITIDNKKLNAEIKKILE